MSTTVVTRRIQQCASSTMAKNATYVDFRIGTDCIRVAITVGIDVVDLRSQNGSRAGEAVLVGVVSKIEKPVQEKGIGLVYQEEQPSDYQERLHHNARDRSWSLLDDQGSEQ